MIYSTAETQSHERAAFVLEYAGGNEVCSKMVERGATEVGEELGELRDQSPNRAPDKLVPQPPADPPVLAVVECEGGRIRTREPDHGPGCTGRAGGRRRMLGMCQQL